MTGAASGGSSVEPVPPAVLVMAKAPVPGQVKTRLGAVVGDDVAAELAAAALLDTLDVCESVFAGRSRRHLALAGDLTGAAGADQIAPRLDGWTVHPQRGDGFAQRLVRAHEDAARASCAPVVQIGMDTPHLSAHDLTVVVELLGVGNDAVLGPATDGGWWVLAVTDARFAAPLAGVTMSTGRTCRDTESALRGAGARVVRAPVRSDLDTVADAAVVAEAAPGTRFARRWRELRER